MKQLVRLRPYLYRYRWSLAFGACLVVGKTLALLQIPGLTRLGIDAISANAGMVPVYRAAGLILAYGLLFWLLTFGMRMIIVGVSRQIEFDLRNDFFDKLLTLSPSYYDRQHSGDLVTRTNSDLGQVRELLGPGLMYPLEVGVLVPLALWQMAALDARLTVLAALPVVLTTAATKVWTGKLRALYQSVQQQMSKLASLIEEGISGIRVIQAYVRENSQIARFRAANDEFLRRNLRLARLESLVFPSLLFLAQLGGVVVLTVGGMAVIATLDSGAGNMTLGAFAQFQLLLGMLTMPMMALGWVINVWQRALVSLERVAAVFDETPLIVASAGAVRDHKLRGEIEARGLTFTYPGADRPALRDITLRLPAGRTLALVGHTGSGKSTFAHLLLRMYPVERGMLFIDGIDINDLHPACLRCQTGLVAQEPFLFAEPLLDNLSFALDQPNRSLAEQLAAVAAMDADLASFPDGIDTVIGERGVTLSGGQRQRAALARALAHDPALLILDDAFSAVDTHTEHLVLGNLRSLLRKRTVVMIAHRISTVMHADKIVVLRDGRLIEEGVHADLVARNGAYARMYRDQLLSEELERTP